MLVLVVLGAVFDIDWDGENYEIDLVNDTAEALEFTMCSDGAACNSPRFDSLVDPGGSYTARGMVDVVGWYRATDEGGNVVGCFKLDFDERPPKGSELLASEIGPCP